jgi:hypothetical protein
MQYKKIITLILTLFWASYSDGQNIYDRALPIDTNRIIITKKGKVGMIDRNNKIIVRAKYDNITPVPNGLAKIQLKEKYGYINMDGKVKVPIKYEETVDYYSSDYIAARKKNRYHIIHKSGKIIYTNDEVPKDFRFRDFYFLDGLMVIEKNKKYGYIDTLGNLVIKMIYDKASNFNDGLASVCIDSSWYFINTKGEVKIKVQGKFENVDGFSNERAKVENLYDPSNISYSRFGFIDTTGNLVIPFKYSDAYYFKNNQSLVKYNYSNSIEIYAIIDKDGNEIFSTKTISPIKYLNNNIKNNIYFYYLNDSLISISCDYKHGLFDVKGNQIIPIEYDDISIIHNGQYLAEKDTINYILDNKGKIVKQLNYHILDYFLSDECIPYLYQGKIGYVDKNCEIIIPAIYDNSSYFCEGLACVEIKGKYGYINTKGELILPAIYEFQVPRINYSLLYCNQFRNGFAFVDIGSRQILIDKKGKEILEIKK